MPSSSDPSIVATARDLKIDALPEGHVLDETVVLPKPLTGELMAVDATGHYSHNPHPRASAWSRGVERARPHMADARRHGKLPACFLIGGCGLFVAIAHWNTPPYSGRGWGYLGILAAVAAFAWALPPIPHKWAKFGAMASLMAALWYGYSTNGDYVKEWERDQFKYRDTFTRTGTITYRHMQMHDATDPKRLFPVTTWSGPMSESVKPHGQSEMRDWDTGETTRQWYWYGEEITEGEWHLRNK